MKPCARAAETMNSEFHSNWQLPDGLVISTILTVNK